MAITKDRAFSSHLAALFRGGASRALTDGQLLERFTRGDGESAELAFAALVDRHGEMVMRVCRAQLSDSHDRQDAFQATFLVLIERARAIWVKDSLGPWLHQVAVRTASRARAAAIRRSRIEGHAAEIAANRDPHEDGVTPDLARALHAEIDRLPERYRVSIVLCDLEGRTCEEAANVLRRPVGTIKCWRSRGRELLRHRLIRAGLVPAVSVEVVLAADIARSAETTLAGVQIVRVAGRMIADGLNAGLVSETVRTLGKGVARSMLQQRMKTAMTVALVVTGLVTAIAAAVQAEGHAPKHPPKVRADAAAHRFPAVPPPPEVPPIADQGPGIWTLSLREAIRIGLENNQAVRVVASEAKDGPKAGDEEARREAVDGVSPIVIAPASPAGDMERFRSTVIGQVRWIALQYWYLHAAQVRLWASERAVDTAREIGERQQAELQAGRGTTADVAEANQRLEQFSLHMVTRTSDLMTTARQLRRMMGLPASENRRIVAATPPPKPKPTPALKQCLSAMFAHQPDVVWAKRFLTDGERRRAGELDMAVLGLIPELADGPEGPTAVVEAQRRLEQFGAGQFALRKTIDQAKGSVVRSRQELDDKFHQVETAARLRIAAGHRLDAQRAYHEEGRITIDRILDAVSLYYTAVCTEADYRAQCAIAMDALEADKGTLLESAGVVLAEGSGGADTSPGRSAGRGERSAGAADRPQTSEDAARADSSGKTYSFDVSIGTGPRPIQVRGSFTVSPAR